MAYKIPRQKDYLKPAKVPTTAKFDAHEGQKRHTGSAMARALGSGSHVSAHSSTHMKSRTKRF